MISYTIFLWSLYNNRTQTTEGIQSDDDFIYGKPWCRIQSYLVGMMLGYIIYQLKGKPFKLNKVKIYLRGYSTLWALFLKTLCIFSKNKAISDKVSYGSDQKCSKKLEITVLLQ